MKKTRGQIKGTMSAKGQRLFHFFPFSLFPLSLFHQKFKNQIGEKFQWQVQWQVR
jgi:hypothetical protein